MVQATGSFTIFTPRADIFRAYLVCDPDEPLVTAWIPDDDWRTIVANAPIVSVDLLVRYDGGLVFGKRQNEPVKGWWFLPGGRVHKGETRTEAVHRVAREELGIEVDIVESLGAFEHFYDTSDVEGVDTKHYLANGYVVDVTDGELTTDEQHSDLRVFESASDPLHDHIRDYLVVAESLPAWP
ncbi:GDP-mannose mannosyl hydrolase [Halorarius litoreus]|uniref:GDP-mannose mannosyl hydrolase n=1 Tax=Halorarius litoreus TaxID=2962676 RepID=UPI0020CC21F1|nr:NUDIX domain-containing protein [Halorarius litoreus]